MSETDKKEKKMRKKSASKLLELADAQFIGFHYGKREPGIIDLIMSMGLTAKEWEKWKAEYTTDYLKESEIEEVNEYFKSIQ